MGFTIRVNGNTHSVDADGDTPQVVSSSKTIADTILQ
jgi:hypothetical protein